LPPDASHMFRVILKHIYLWISHVDVDTCEILQGLGPISSLIKVSSNGFGIAEVFQEVVDVEDVVEHGVALEARCRPSRHAVRNVVEELVAGGPALAAGHHGSVGVHVFAHLKFTKAQRDSL